MKKINIHPGVKALIFDCDGTLVDSMPLHMEAWKVAMEKHGAVYNFDFFFSKKGMKEKNIIDQYNSLYNTKLNEAEVVETKHKYFRQNIFNVKPIDAVVEIAEKYKNILPMAVVSGGTRENVLTQLKIIGIDSYFKIVLTADDAFKPKPAPDLFLEAARVMGAEPGACQVFEDGELGLFAAKNAGMITTDVREYM